MIKIGITGGIGSGKTTVCNVFQALGIPVFNADDEARRLMQENVQAIEKINALFGIDAYKFSKLNREKIARMVFEDSNLLNDLNAIVHPLVINEYSQWTTNHINQPYIIKEAAILFEANTQLGLDFVIVVKAPEKLRIERIMKRDGVSAKHVKQRMNNQWPESRKIQLADFVILNNNIKPLLPQIIKLHNFFLNYNSLNQTK